MNKELFTFDAPGTERLDVFLSACAPSYSRNLIQTLIKNGAVTVNGKIRKPGWKVESGDEVEVTWPEARAENKLKDLIIYEDRNMFVINKPSGLLVHPQSPVWETNPQAAFASDETLASLILSDPPKYFRKDIERAGLVHRLDKDTSGVMLIAKNNKTQAALAELFSSRQVTKEYEAILCGELKDKEGIINVPVGRVAGGKIKASELGREAITKYKAAKIKNGFTWAKLYPYTGRTNQLRVHMSWLGYPVLGDYLYKGATAARLMLHARKLTFENPVDGEKMVFEAPAPQDFQKAWTALTKDV